MMLFRRRLHSCIILFVILVMMACRQQQDKAPGLFTKLPAAVSGVTFSNDIHETDSTNSFINEFGYMGGGVGIGDFNNDGLKDIFFSGNQVSSRLYINKGNNTFEDITQPAGVTTNVWCTGVSIVDINNDGYDDIYVCVFGKNLLSKAKNLLFINRHNGTFKESAAAYGLDYSGYSTQAAFFDYDSDGDLDMFLANYLLNGPNANTIFPCDRSGHSPANDKLFRNDAAPALGHPVFTDVSMEAGIKEDGYGLGLVISDINNDGWPDVYVANDFLTNDELWLNNRNGTFTNSINRAMRHQGYSCMGADAGDINNVGLADVITLDMLPEYNERKKTSFFFMNYERYEAERSMGYEPEFMRNMLQLNNGNIQHGDTSLPFFSEIGQLAGIQSTDWSWSVLLADVDNDGWKDIHITNGIGRDFINADFLEFSNTIFAGNKSKEEQQQVIREKLASLKHVSLPNYLYLSNHDLTFSDASQAAGIDELSMSNGAAYADLDNDGDLDIVVNNIDKPAFVFINNSIQKDKPVTNHSISINLQGDSLNRHAFGAKVFVYNDGRLQLQEQNPVRGYFSSVDQKLLFGVGKAARIDSMVIQWPGSRRTVLTNIAADTLITVAVSDAVGFNPGKAISQPTIFSDAVFATNIFYQHKDNVYNDFALQRLLPQKFSQLGPFITTGDINKDGLADFFIGGAFNFSGRFFVQQPNGSFVARILTDSIKMEEDMDCVLFDADDDGDVDLLIGSGDLLYEDSAAYYVPRLYLNNGKGNFSLRPNAIPATVKAIAGSISIGDYDGDGSPDVFIGGRVSHQYPLAPRSFILHNNKGVFTDVTATVCPVLQQPGMVTAAAWTDFDNDHQLDLIVAGEWMPIRFFKNNHGQLLEVTGNTGLGPMNGMWRSMTIADMDNDGDADIVAGNLGLNCIYHTNETVPMQLLAADLDGNGSIDPVFFYYIKDNDGKKSLFPSISRTQLSEQVPAVKKQFLYNKQYAVATADDIFKGKAKDNKVTLTCTETRSCYLENLGNGKFAKHPLPIAAQFAPVNAIICDDIDGDGKMDIVLAGNEYQADVMTGRYDASYGCFLKGNGKNIFTSITPVQSGLVLNGDIKDMSLLRTAKGEKLLLAAANNDSLRVFRVKK